MAEPPEDLRPLIGYAAARLNAQHTPADVVARMQREHPEWTRAEIRRAVELAGRYIVAGRTAQSLSYASRVLGQAISTIEGALDPRDRPGPGGTVSAKIGYTGETSHGVRIRGSVVIAVPAGTLISIIESRFRAALASGALGLRPGSSAVTHISVEVFALAPYERDNAYHLDVAPYTADHPNMYRRR